MTMRKNFLIKVVCFTQLAILLLGAAGCAANRNVSASGDNPKNMSTASDSTTQAAECTTTSNEATTIPTEPEAVISTTAPEPATEPAETVPQETKPAEVDPTVPSATEPVETLPQETIPSETIPPATEVMPTAPIATEPVHVHSYSTNTTTPTCTAQGYTTFVCSCGSSYQDRYTQATGHSWGSWTVTKEATTSAAGEQIRTCSVCGSTETQAIAQLPAEEPTEPAACQHSWETKYYPEQGHYGESYILCVCGHKCQTQEQWLDHVKNIGGAESVLYHASWSIGSDYIVDSPERYEWVCSDCGLVSNTQP